MEHYLSPLSELQKNIQKVKKGGYLLIEVPGIFHTPINYFNPILYFQNAHVFDCYYCDYLINMFQQLGLDIIYSDERCTFICKKKENWMYNSIQTIEIPENISNKYPALILNYLQQQKRAYKYRFFNIKFLKHMAFIFLNKVGYKNKKSKYHTS
jgi:hypothetical protein